MSFAFLFYNHILPGMVATFVVMVFILIFRIISLTPSDWDLINNGLGENLKEIIPQKYAYVSFFIFGSIIYPIFVNLFFDVSDPRSQGGPWFLFLGLFMILLMKDSFPRKKRIRIGFVIVFLHILYSCVFWFIWFVYHHLGDGPGLTPFT